MSAAEPLMPDSDVPTRERALPSRLRTDLSAFQLVPPPGRPQRLGQILTLAVLLAVLLLLFVPWVQTVSGQGQVIAFGPADRPQTLESNLKGVVGRWLVTEGETIVRGQPLVEVVDLDPDLVSRLEVQRTALQDKIEAQSRQISAFEQQVTALEDALIASLEAQEAYLDQAMQKREAALQKRGAAETTLEVARLQLGRQESLAEEGLASRRDLDLATLSVRKAEAELRSAQAEYENARRKVDAERAGLGQKRAETRAKAEDVRAKLQKVRSDREDARSKLADQQIKLARQGYRVIASPRDGTLFKIFAVEGPAQVKVGDPLAIIVPTVQRRAVEMWLDGNDAAWVDAGREVRLQFEGWPAIQFAGWPGASVGTFGGRVTFIDSTDDGKGSFRVVIEPVEDQAPWPDPNLLRQGVRTKGWVLLDTVTLGFEAWRRLNGFPPQTEVRKVPKLPKFKT